MNNVLIVDDSSQSRNHTIKIVTKLGLNVIAEAIDVEDGINKCLELKPDIVLLDNIMPSADGTKSGLDVCRAIKEKCPKTRIIMLTADKDKRTIMNAIKLGIDDYIIKPIDEEKVRFALIKAVDIEIVQNKKTVLIADDSALIRAVVKEIVAKLDLTVTGETETVDDTLKFVENHKPDLIILDIAMPSKDSRRTGIDVCSLIKTKYPDIKIIMLTATSNKQTLITSIKKGADDYIVKPVDEARLIKSLKTVLKIR